MSDRWDGLFKWIWRVDGLILLPIGVVGVVGILLLLGEITVSSSGDTPDQRLTHVADTDIGAKDLRLSDFHSIEGTTYLYAQLASASGDVLSGPCCGGEGTRNFLFFDTVSKKARWLFSTNEQTIPSFHLLFDPPERRAALFECRSDEDHHSALAILLEIHRKANSGEGQETDSRILALASPDGRELKPITDSIDGLLGYHQTGRETVLLFYVLDGAAKVIDFDPISRTVRSDTLLSTDE